MLHLGWFVGRGYSVHAWNQPWSGSIGADWALGERLIELARAMDQACFDYVLIEDGSFAPTPTAVRRNGICATPQRSQSSTRCRLSP